jgi:predicted DNA-binding transcriptional regulator AlpA
MMEAPKMHDPTPKFDTPFLDTPAVAALLGLSPKTLESLRVTRPHDGPPFLRIGRAVRYSRSALNEWLAARMIGGGA